MDNLNPVYTLRNECHDCYKCVRGCHVKAIRVENGHAAIIPQKCIACGRCVKACPSEAKRVRDDLAKAKNLISANKKVIVSLAPSWVGAFKQTKSEMLAALKALGITAVSETALGAQEVTAKVIDLLGHGSEKLLISTACPVIVDYLRYYRPEFVKYLAPIASPAITHAKMLKELYGAEIAVVFIGPCIGKKNEADRHHDLIDVALTFAELKIWLNDALINLQEIVVEPGQEFLPHQAHEGSLYPLDGGMNATLRKAGLSSEVDLINICSLELFSKSLEELQVNNLKRKVFIEALACDGGCIAGPCIATPKSIIGGITSVLANVQPRAVVPARANFVVAMHYTARPVVAAQYSPTEIGRVLKRIGKHCVSDELNCGGCGYSTCQELAVAMLSGNAEPSMCVSYMRQLAVRKAALMLKSMPSAMVMIDANFKIVEANDAFMKMFLGESYEVFAARSEGLGGAYLEKVVDFVEIFRTTLQYGKEVHKEHYSYKGLLYDINTFSIEPHELVGAIITDVTQSEVNRAKIAKKAQQVISSNIATVQEIACLLGEHMVATEALLSSIADDYQDNKNDEAGECS